jgi:hypothetical protein
MSKSCISPNLPKVVEFVKNMQPMFGGFLNDNQIVGLLNNWIDAKQTETYPTADELVAFFAESKESVPEKENVLDVIQSLYFEWLKDFSGSPIITREIVNKYSAEIFETLPLMFKDENLGFIAANFDNYKELLLKTRLQHVAIPIDELLVDVEADTKDRIGEHASNMDDLMGRGSDKVKYLFASLQSEEKIYGLNRPANYTKCWNVTQGLLQNTVNLDEQIAILQTNRTAYPFIDQLIDKLGAETESLEYTDLQTSFYESFCKANYDITIAQQGEKQSYSEVHLKTKNGLISQYKSNFRNSKYAKRVAGNLIVDKDTINEVLPTELSNEAFVKFLNAFGIPIKELPENLQHVPNKNTPISRLMHFVKNNKDAGLDWLIAEGNFGKNTEQGNFDKVLDYLTEKEKGEIKTSVRNAEGETINTIANHNYFTRLFNGLKNLLNKNKFQELLSSNKVIANIASGLKRGDESKNFNKLGLGEIYVAKISNMFSGEPSINIPVTSDKTLVRTIKFRRPTSGSVEEYYNDMMAYTAIGPQLYTRLFEVYQRDLNAKFSPNWKYGSDNAIDYWHGTETKEGIFGKIDSPLSKEGFILKIDAYLNTQNALLKESLVKSGAVSIVGETVNANFNFPKVQGTSMEKLNTTLNLVNFNELLFGTEITQEMYGSMVGTITEDFFKRNAGGVAEGRQVRVDDIINKAIQTDRSNSVLNMANYPMGKLRVLIHAKTKQSSTNKELIAQYADYKNLDVDDAQGTMPLEMYRETLQRSSQWKDAQEKAYQKIISGKKLTTKELKEVQGIFPPIKPVGYSLVTITDKKGISYKVPVYIKTAVYPIFKTDSVGTLNEAKYDMMSSKGVGLVIPVSGIKMATPKNAKALFNENGQINFDEVNTIDFPMEDFRIQLDINQKTSNDLLQGTQQRKLQYTDLFEGGKAINPKYQKLLSENIETLQEMSDIETQKLYAKAGIVETKDEAGNPDYSIKDYNKLVTMLRDELLNRNMSTNTVEAIKSIVSDKGLLLSTIDGLPSRQKLMNLLNSIVTNKLIKLQTNGSSLVQISQHGWEMAPIADATDKKILAAKCAINFLSDDHKLEYYKNKGLKFFSLGKDTGAAQIILPAKYKKFVTLKDGKYVIDDAKCLLNIGYRIPTQGHNSMLHLEVVGFLPEHMDQMVIMPKEITTQGGSDFDVDKLNIFIPNVISSNGKKLFIDSEMDGEVAWKDYVAAKDPKNIGLSAEERDFFSTIEYTDEELSDIVETQNLNKEEFLQTFRIKQLQNKLITQAEEILKDPEVRSKLLTPNSADSLKQEAEKLAAELKARGLSPIEIVPTYANMLSSRTLAEMAYQMSAAKALVGVFASQSTNHTLGQQVGLHFKTGRPLFFEHNTIDVQVETREGPKDETFIDLSGTKSKDGKYIISYMLGNEYLTAAVDAAKKDYLSELGVNLRTGDFVAAYTRMGGSTDYLRYWMKNPIIQEYLSKVEINDSLAISQYKKTSKSEIIRDIAKKYGVKNVEYIIDKYDGNEDLAKELRESRTSKPNGGKYSAAKLKKLALLEETNIDASFDLLNDYLYFEDAALVIRQNISNTKFDVAGPGKDIVETKLLQLSYDAFLSQMSLPFGYTLGTSRDGTQFGYEALVTDTQLNVFYKKSFKFVQSIYKDLVLLEKDQVLAGAVSSLIANSPYTYKKASPEEAALVYGTAINYIIQQDNPLKESLFFGDNTIAHRIQKIQSDENSPLNKNFIIQEIQTEIAAAQNNPSLIGFKNKNITSLESDYISKAFGEIKELNKDLYDDLIAASLYQTGVVQSPLSYYNLVPYSDILPIINKALNNHSAVILGGSHTTELIASIIANVGDKLKNIQRANISEADIIGERDIYGTIELPLEKTKEKELIKLRISIGTGSHQGFYIGVGNGRYKYIAPKNYKGLFYNLTNTNLEFASEEDSDSDVVETEPLFLPVATQPKSIVATNIKEGVQELFESNPELATIGTQKQYSQYLDSIFPNSQVKDIVYHGANEPIEGEEFTKREGATGKGIWFSGSKKYSQIQMDRAQPSESLIGRKLRGAPTMYKVVLNIKNPKNFYNSTGALLVQTPSKFEEQYDRKNNDAVLFHHPESKKPATADSADQIVVFEPEQIHILGNKQDIEGFKKFSTQPQAPKSLNNLEIPDNIQELNNPNRVKQIFKFGIKNFGTIEVVLPTDKNIAPNVNWILKNNQQLKQPNVAIDSYKELNNYLQSLGFLPLKSDSKNISKGALNIWKSLVTDNLATEIGISKIGKPIYQFIDNTTQPQAPAIEASLALNNKALTVEEADWLYNNIKQISEKYNSYTLANSIDTELKTPLLLDGGKTKVTAINPQAGDETSIMIERPSGKFLIGITQRKGELHIELASLNDKGTYYSTRLGQEDIISKMKDAKVLDLIEEIYKDTNIPQPLTRVENFEAQNRLQQKYGLKRTYKDIVNELANFKTPVTEIVPEVADEAFTKITWASLTDNERAGLLKHVSPRMFESLTEEVQKNMIECFKLK